MTTRFAQLPKQRADIHLVAHGPTPTLQDGHGHELLVLNATAAALWSLCDGDTAPGEMVDAVCEICNVDHASAKADIERTLDVLTDAGLLEWVHRG
jgi:hypothetical protein